MKRYLILAEGASDDPGAAKTAYGVVKYGPHRVVALLDSRRPGAEVLGVPVVATVDDGLAHRPDTALIGVAPAGGILPDAWRQTVLACIRAGLDIESGLHVFLADDPELAAAARGRGVEVRDLRRPPDDLVVTTGDNLRHGAGVVLTVGSDCNSGKMTAAMELDRAARARGVRSAFVPTGQTGIAIAGWGIAIDAVVSDFIAGAAERLVVEGAQRADLLWVEGQGSLVHPMYSGVTLGLYHGAAPHAIVLCHVAGQTHIEDLPEHPLTSLAALVERHERTALPLRPARVAAIALNTRHLDEPEAREAIRAAAAETGLPVSDPARFGAEPLLDAVLQAVPVPGSPH